MARALTLAVVIGTAFTHAPLARAATEADSIRYTVRITSINRVGLTTTNYGFFGNNFNSRSPSFEYPLGTGYEHMARGGLWIGGLALSDTGQFIGVTSSVVDNSQGTNALAETEFTPAGNAIEERSRIANSRVYSPNAISDQDFECTFSDEPARSASGFQRERHTPLDILVRQRSLGFSLSAAQDFVVLRFDVVNQGPPMRDVYVGFYAQLVSGSKNSYSTWPPSATSGPGSWYYKVHAEFDSTRRLYQEHYCQNAPYPSACNSAYCPPWVGVQLLGVHPDTIANKTVSFNWWSYSPGDTARDVDRERYALMKNGLKMDPSTCQPGGQCSPIVLLSVGPFAQVLPGDTVTVDFALVGGEDQEALLHHADFAQFASDIRYELPAPPPSPRLHVATGANHIDYFWDDSPERTPDPTSPAPGHLDFEGYRLYLGLDRQHPTLITQFDADAPPHDTTGFNTGFAAVRFDTVIAGVPYRYRYSVRNLKDGFSYFGAITSFDLGDEKVGSQESGIGQNLFQAVPNPAAGERTAGVTVYPNPYRVEARWDEGTQVRDHYLWFAQLPPRCVLSIFTLGGDRVFTTRFDGSTYHGEGTRGLFDPRQDVGVSPPALSGSSFAWNLITDQGQAIASGLYLFAVEDLASGHMSRGKFLVIKSDREDR